MSSKFFENGYLTPSTVHKIGRFTEFSLLPPDHGTGAWSILRQSNLCQGHSETGPDGGGWWNSEQDTSRQIVMKWRLSPDFPAASSSLFRHSSSANHSLGLPPLTNRSSGRKAHQWLSWLLRPEPLPPWVWTKVTWSCLSLNITASYC